WRPPLPACWLPVTAVSGDPLSAVRRGRQAGFAYRRGHTHRRYGVGRFDGRSSTEDGAGGTTRRDAAAAQFAIASAVRNFFAHVFLHALLHGRDRPPHHFRHHSVSGPSAGD